MIYYYRRYIFEDIYDIYYQIIMLDGEGSKSFLKSVLLKPGKLEETDTATKRIKNAIYETRRYKGQRL